VLQSGTLHEAIAVHEVRRIRELIAREGETGSDTDEARIEATVA